MKRRLTKRKQNTVRFANPVRADEPPRRSIGSENIPPAIVPREDQAMRLLVRRQPPTDAAPLGDISLTPTLPDYFLRLQQGAFQAIGEARKRRDNKIGFYTAEQVRVATEFLDTLCKKAQSTGPRGDKPQAKENQTMLSAFFWLSQGKNLKSIAIELEAPDAGATKNQQHSIAPQRSLVVRMKRFSHRVYEAVRSHSGCDKKGQIPASFLQHDKSHRWLSSYFGIILQWPGIIHDCPEHGYALCEALRRATSGSRPSKRRGRLVQIGPTPRP